MRAFLRYHKPIARRCSSRGALCAPVSFSSVSLHPLAFPDLRVHQLDKYGYLFEPHSGGGMPQRFVRLVHGLGATSPCDLGEDDARVADEFFFDLVYRFAATRRR